MNDHDLKQRQPNDDLTDLRDCLRAAREKWRLSCCFPGDPVSKGRPRMTRSGHTYTPERTRTAEKELAAFVQAHMGARHLSPSGNALRLNLAFCCATARRVDCSNLAKLVEDALNEVAYVDDSQIVELHVTKQVDRTHPRTVIEIEEVAP